MKRESILLSAACLVGGALAPIFIRQAAQPAATSDEAAAPAYMAVLESKLLHLESVQDDLRDELAQSSRAVAPAPVASLDNQQLDRISEQLGELKARLEELQDRVANAGAGGEGASEFSSKTLAESLGLFVERTQDPTLTPGERVASLDVLRKYPSAINSSVVGSMLSLLSEPGVPDQDRSGIVRALNGVADERCRDAFLLVLETDPSERVREEAAESLKRFSDEPLVRDGLLRAAGNDASEAVRREAQRSAGSSSNKPGDDE
ncbi:MAG: HEAT repeat domain-containing protein [Planctomycetota bacterium]|jgi:HEAT repeat protein